MRFLAEQALFLQAFKTEQHRVAGKSGETLVRGVAIPGGIQRQHLPQLLSGCGKEISEFVGARAEIADAETTGQRSKVQQDSTTTRDFHAVTIHAPAALEQRRSGLRSVENARDGGQTCAQIRAGL